MEQQIYTSIIKDFYSRSFTIENEIITESQNSEDSTFITNKVREAKLYKIKSIHTRSIAKLNHRIEWSKTNLRLNKRFLNGKRSLQRANGFRSYDYCWILSAYGKSRKVPGERYISRQAHNVQLCRLTLQIADGGCARCIGAVSMRATLRWARFAIGILHVPYARHSIGTGRLILSNLISEWTAGNDREFVGGATSSAKLSIINLGGKAS